VMADIVPPLGIHVSLSTADSLPVLPPKRFPVPKMWPNLGIANPACSAHSPQAIIGPDV
jgi:hypothetical protein